MSSGPTHSSQAESQTLHPALLYIAHAISAYQRSGFETDANAFMNWAICHFDQDEYERAFFQVTPLPTFTTAEADYQYAEDMIKKVAGELQRKKLQNDIVDLWMLEIDLYKERRRRKREVDAEEAEERRIAEERQAVENVNR